MDEKQGKAITANGNTREDLIARIPIPGPGRPKDTEIKKLEKKAIKILVQEYKESLAEALVDINPVLIQKAKGGDMVAIKEINDVVVDKAVRKTDITTAGKPFPLLGGITKNADSNNDSDEEVAEAEQED